MDVANWIIAVCSVVTLCGLLLGWFIRVESRISANTDGLKDGKEKMDSLESDLDQLKMAQSNFAGTTRERLARLEAKVSHGK